MSRQCPACGGRHWLPLLALPGRPALASDLRQVDRSLDKYVCAVCGLAANRCLRGAAALADYADTYALNTTGGEEHLYFTDRGPVARSAAVLDWLQPYLPIAPDSVLEVGCGQGNLLARLATAFPRARVQGTEASHRAAELARSRGLHVDARPVAPDALPLPTADLVVCFGVLEHVDDPEFFLADLRRACRPGGRAAIVVPVQEAGGYDLFFEDHVWHFTRDRLVAVACRAGWRPLAYDAGHPVVRGFGLLVCTPDGGSPSPGIAPESTSSGSLQVANRDAWLARFSEVDRRLAALGAGSVAVFGAGEIFALLHTYTSLGNCRIECLIDDNPARHAAGVRGIPVAGRDWLAVHPDIPVFVAVNPRYNRRVAEGLSALSKRIVFWC